MKNKLSASLTLSAAATPPIVEQKNIVGTLVPRRSDFLPFKLPSPRAVVSSTALVNTVVISLAAELGFCARGHN